MNIRRTLLPFFVVALVTGCAPEIGLRVSVPNVPEPQTPIEQSLVTAPVKVKVGSFTDGRPAQTIVLIDGRRVDSEGSLGSVVSEGFTRYLRDAGARIAILDAPTIDGQITEWRATVTPDFPASEAKAQARLKVTVRDAKAKPLYNATFTGEATASHPLMDEKKVTELLAQAMGSALESAVKDENFMAQLAAGRAH